MKFREPVKSSPDSPVQWFTAFPQIVSRIGHPNRLVVTVLSKLISSVIRGYPNQALWFFAPVVNSTKTNREQRGRAILDQLKVSRICHRSIWEYNIVIE